MCVCVFVFLYISVIHTVYVYEKHIYITFIKLYDY